MTWRVCSRPVAGGRSLAWMVIDGEKQFCTLDDEHQARALAATLNGADPVYRAELAKLNNAEPF